MKTLFAAVAASVLLTACSGEAEQQAATSTAEDDVAGFVADFMKVRQAGLPAHEFLAPSALAAYEDHDAGLWLYDDSLPGGPGGQFDRYSFRASPGKVVLRIRVVFNGDAKPTDMVEELTLRSGTIAEVRRIDGPGRDGLSFEAAMKREDIYRAAVRQDYQTLATLLDPETFSYSFGGSGDPIGYWREQEEAEIPLLGDVLPGVLHTRFGKNGDIYVWPSAAAKEAPDWTKADVESMREAGYTDDEIDSFRRFGGYTGWRAGIRSDGTWLYFIAGD